MISLEQCWGTIVELEIEGLTQGIVSHLRVPHVCKKQEHL